MRRYRPERDEDTAAERQAPPPAPSPDSVLALIQRGAGNANVSRMLARQAAPDAEQEGTPVIAPHEPGDMSEDLRGFGGHEADRTPVTAPVMESWAPVAQPAPGQQAPQVPKEISDWLNEHPSTNATIADWLLRGKGYGFLTFTSGDFYEQQIRDISKRATSVNVFTTLGGEQGKLKIDPDARLGVMTILESLLRGHADRWVADPSKKKTVLQAGDLMRNLKDASVADAHAGPSADLYRDFDWGGANGPAQVLQALGDLPPGSYKIGLPFQGQFFPNEKYLATRQEAAIAAAGPDGTPAPITQPSMIKFNNNLYTSTWNPAKKRRNGTLGGYDDTATGGQHGGVAELRSASLRKGIADLAAKGIKITAVFADNNNHIHITRD
jgi:hypothetical protein